MSEYLTKPYMYNNIRKIYATESIETTGMN